MHSVYVISFCRRSQSYVFFSIVFSVSTIFYYITFVKYVFYSYRILLNYIRNYVFGDVMKQRINICVDTDIYMQLKLQVGEGKISALVNEFFRNMLNMHTVNAEEQQVLQQLDRAKEAMELHREEIIRLSAIAAAVRERNKKLALEEEERRQLLHDSLRLNNPLRNL